MLSEEDLEQVKMQIATDLAEVRSEYDSKIENLTNLAKLWQALAVQAIAELTPQEADRDPLRKLLRLLKESNDCSFVDDWETRSEIETAEAFCDQRGQPTIVSDSQQAEIDLSLIQGEVDQLRVDVNRLCSDALDLFSRTHETDNVQLVMIRRTLNWQLTMTRLFCKMDYVHQGDIRELLGAAVMDHNAVPQMDDVMTQMDVILDKIPELHEEPSGERARDALDTREERAIMLDA